MNKNSKRHYFSVVRELTANMLK